MAVGDQVALTKDPHVAGQPEQNQLFPAYQTNEWMIWWMKKMCIIRVQEALRFVRMLPGSWERDILKSLLTMRMQKSSRTVELFNARPEELT